MNIPVQPFLVVLADDDPADCRLVLDAFAEAGVRNEVRCVKSGEELMDYLHRRGAYSTPQSAPRPGLILLDLNMPRKDGREVLAEMKSDPALRRIPVIVMTTSRAAEDVQEVYDLGANSFISKPDSFDELVELVRTLARYWTEFATLPLAPD